MTTFFRDVSNWDRGASLAGQPFVVAKSSEGTWFRDAYYHGYKDQAQAMGIGFAAYHWLSRGVNPTAQADFAYEVSGGVPMMVDDESQGGMDIKATVTFIRRYRENGGQCNVEYLPHWYWQGSGSPNLQPLIDLRMSLVSSNYSEPYSDHGVGFQPYGGMTPSIWQYSSTPYDQNGFPGTVDELNRLFGTITVPALKGKKMFCIRSGGTDGSIAFVPGYQSPLGKIVAIGISSLELAAAYQALFPTLQLPDGVTIPDANYEFGPVPWPTNPITWTPSVSGTWTTTQK